MRHTIQSSAGRIGAGSLLGVCLSAVSLADIHYSDFSSTAGLNLVQDAVAAGGVLQVTPSVSWQNGAAWFGIQQHLADGFETRFRFRLTPVGGGADGFTFTLQGMSPTAIGDDGGCMGYSNGYGSPPMTCSVPNGITRSLVVEFDTYFNGDMDPNANHISVQTRGEDPNCADQIYSLGLTTTIPDLNDGAAHTVVIRYAPGTMSIFLDDLVTPVLTVPLDLTAYPALPWGWAGFTAATGSSLQSHEILEWHFTEGLGNNTTYCMSSANSTGQPALLGMTGSPSVLQNDFVLSVTDCPSGNFGLFIYGQGAANFPLGDGTLCISPFNPGLFRLMPVVQVGGNGGSGMAMDMNALPVGGAIVAGSTWNFQFWFRDALPGGSGSNLSSAMRASFTP